MKYSLLKYTKNSTPYFGIKKEVKGKYIKLSSWFIDLKELEEAVKRRTINFMHFEVGMNEEFKYPKADACLSMYKDKDYYDEMMAIAKNSEVLYEGTYKIDFDIVKKEFPELFI